MRNPKGVFIAFALILLVAVVLVFILENQQTVSLLFFGWTGPQLPLSIVVVLALLFGMLIGPISGWVFARVVGRRQVRIR